MNKCQKWICVIGIFICFSVAVCIAVLTGIRYGYKEACSDFYHGKLKMELVENPDGTREWKTVEKENSK